MKKSVWLSKDCCTSIRRRGNMFDYDVVFVGSGHASWHAAVPLVSQGKKVAIAEEDTIAGTCTNWGCNAKYLLDTPYDFVDGLQNYRGLGVNELPQINWGQLAAYKKQSITPMHVFMEGMFQKMGIAVLRGHASLADAHTVRVVGKDGSQTQVTSEYVVLGTGEHSNRQDIPGKELLHDSRDFLDLNEFPGRIAFIGAGIISMEFASIALKQGATTTIIHHSDQALRQYPKRYVDTLVAKMREEGANFVFNTTVTKAETTGNKSGAFEPVRLTLSDGSVVEADYVVDATGRVPNVEGLGLENLGIEFSRRGIKVDDHLRTAVPNVFASGDVIDKRIPKLTPTAEFESNYIAGQILGNPAPIEYPAIPNLVFTLPRIAQVGVSVDAALADPEHYDVASEAYGQQLTFMAKSDKASDFTFVTNKEGDLVGCAIYGVDAGELINFATMVINLHLTQADLNKMIFSFPGTTYGFIAMMKKHLRRA